MHKFQYNLYCSIILWEFGLLYAYKNLYVYHDIQLKTNQSNPQVNLPVICKYKNQKQFYTSNTTKSS